MTLSLVFATSKRTEILSRTLTSFTQLKTNGFTWEIILVDNANDSKTQDVVRQFEGQLPLTYVVETRKGKNYALNTAISKVKGQLIVFTDDDVLVEADWLEKIWEGANRWPNHHVFGGKILPHFPIETVKFDLNHRLIRQAYTIADWPLPEGEYKPSMVYGPNFAIRSSVLDSGFRFNTEFGPNSGQYLMGDETEFVYRLEQAGYKPVYLPDALVYHQIRPEQVSVDWLSRRVSSHGATFAFMSGLPHAAKILGVPRYIYIKTLQAFVKYAGSYLQSNDQARLASGLDYWYRKGMLKQYWRGVPKEKMIEY